MAGARAADGAASSPLFGREDLLEEAERLLERAAAGTGEGLLLTGSAGSGKSHVLRAVRDRAASRGYRLLTGRALPEELPPPFSLLRDLLGSKVEDETSVTPVGPDPAPLPIFLAPIAATEVDEPRRPAATRSTAAQDELDRILAPFGRSAIEGLGAAREVLLGRLVDHVRSLAADRPLLLAIDDLQLADPSSLEFLERFARELPTVRAAIVATLDSGAGAAERTRPVLEVLSHSPAFRSVAIRPLTLPESTEFVRWILGGRAPDPQDVTRWHAQTEGNPLFLEQLVRASTGFGPSHRAAPVGGGRNITEILVTRVRTLPENDRRVLTYAAVLGKEFSFADLAAVAGLGEERVTESLDHLVQNALVREKGREVYEFVSEAVRTSVYADLTETRRRILHLKAGQALEALGSGRESELARQFYLGRDNERAVKYNVEAANRAVRAFAFETAVAHLARALEAERRRVERDPGVEIRLLTDEGRILSEMGNLRQSEEILGEAVTLARSKTGHDLELSRALLGLADVQANRGEYTSAEELANDAWALLTKVGTKRDLMSAHRVLGVVHWRRGDLAQAEIHQRAALEIARREGTPLEQGHAMVDVAITISPRGPTNLEPALELLSAAAEIFGKEEDFSARARVLMDRAVLEHEAGREESALRDIALAIEAAERSRSPIWIGYCYVNLAQWEAKRGRADLARPALARAEQALAPSGDRLGEQQLELTRGMIAHAERAYDDAERHYQEALSQARAIHLATDALEAWVRLAQLSHDRGADEEARNRIREIRASGLLEHRSDLGALIYQIEQAMAPASAARP